MNVTHRFQQVDVLLAQNRLACPVKFNDIFIGAIGFYQNEFKKRSFGKNYLTGVAVLEEVAVSTVSAGYTKGHNRSKAVS